MSKEMSVIDLIKQLQREQEEAKRRALLEAQQSEQNQLRAEEESRKKRLEEELKREREKLSELVRIAKVIEDSGVPNEFNKIGKEALGAIKHDVLTDPDKKEVSLIWGRYKLRNGQILDNRLKDYSYIIANFTTTEGADFVSINSRKSIPLTWLDNQLTLKPETREIIKMDIAQAYLNPKHEVWSPPVSPGSSSYSSGSSGSTECCCT